MLHDPDYKAKWGRKLEWYRSNGILPCEDRGGENDFLLITTEGNGSIDALAIERKIRSILHS